MKAVWIMHIACLETSTRDDNQPFYKANILVFNIYVIKDMLILSFEKYNEGTLVHIYSFKNVE